MRQEHRRRGDVHEGIEETQKQVDEEKVRATAFMKDLYPQVKDERDKNPHGPAAPEQAPPSHAKAKAAGIAAGVAVALVPGASLLARGAIEANQSFNRAFKAAYEAADAA